MTDTREFIEVKRVISDKSKLNVSTEPETISIELIEAFRGWKKGKNDELIKGEMTLIVLKQRKDGPAEKVDGQDMDAKKKVRTMLIQESYASFLGRMSSKVIIRTIQNEAS